MHCTGIAKQGDDTWPFRGKNVLFPASNMENDFITNAVIKIVYDMGL
jgi:hypothetical protein